MISFWQVLVLLGIFAASILLGVMVGAYAVFKTKREAHEPFVGSHREGEVFSIDNFGEDLDVTEEGHEEPPELIQKRNMDFIGQFADKVGGGMA